MERPPYVHAFIDSYLPCARSVELFFRIPVSVTLAYAAMESDWGRSSLAMKGILFGQPLKQEDATGSNSVKVSKITNGKKTIQYFRKTTAREAFMAYAESLQRNPLFKDAHRYFDVPERFLEVIASGYETMTEREKAQMARVALKEYKLRDFDSWLFVESQVY